MVIIEIRNPELNLSDLWRKLKITGSSMKKQKLNKINYTIIILILLSVLTSCGGGSNQQAKDNIQNTIKLHDSALLTNDSNIINLKSNALANKYKSNMINPDTNLAVFLYENYGNNEYVGFYEQYQRWVLESKTIKPLIIELFKEDESLDSIMIILEAKKEKIILLTREIVEEIYDEYNGISGPDFEFLCEIRDNMALELIESIKDNPRASKDEKQYAIEMKLKYFN
jgi:hypothetical protein